MHSVWLTILGLMGLLAFAVLLVPASKSLSFPYTVLLAGAGLLLGLCEIAIAGRFTGPIQDFLSALNSIQITSEVVFLSSCRH